MFVDIEDLDGSINMMVYGDAGVGKTVFAASADNVLFLAPEANTVSARRQGLKAKVWPIKNWDDLESAYSWLYDNQDNLPFNWVVIDTLDRMQSVLMVDILQQAHKENAKRSLVIPAQPDYLENQIKIQKMVLAFVELPVNMLFLAHAKKDTDEEGEPFLTPDIQGKGSQISQSICAMMSCYGYMRIMRLRNPNTDSGKPFIRQRRIIWEDTGVIRGKDQYDVLAPYTNIKNFRNPKSKGLTLKDLEDMILAEPEEGK